MVGFFVFILTLVLAVFAFIAAAFFISSIKEQEKRASVLGAAQLTPLLALIAVVIYLYTRGFFNSWPGTGILIGATILIIMTTAAVVAKTFSNPRALAGTGGFIAGEVKRFDERLTVFSRNRSLRPDSAEFELFYHQHPELKEIDTARRKLGGPVGIPGVIDRPNEKPNLAMSQATGSLPYFLSTPEIHTPRVRRGFSDLETGGYGVSTKDRTSAPAREGSKGDPVVLDPREATERVKGFTRHLGADLVGICEINSLWTYSHRGEIFHENWEDWGKQINLTHKYAIVFTMEMSFEMIVAAPHTPSSIESQLQYARGAFIATQLAAFISNLGYPAIANHSRNYDALLVPLAVDAGLGELGRFGYLITRQYGPRVRLGAVTTDLPLIPDQPVDIGVEDFCRVCKKCAVCCPSRSIPMGEKIVANGTRRWKLNAETCFEYWGKIGTGCNVCMHVCPWSHASTFPHRVIKKLVSRNMVSRRLFTVMDDIFYGKKPRPRQAPPWASYR